MEFSKRDNFVVLSKLTTNELFCILKCQIECTLTFDNNGILDFIDLKERLIHGNSQKISVVYNDGEGGTEEITTYAALLENIKTKLQVSIMHVEIHRDLFKDKEPLIALVNDMRLDVIENAVFIDYDNGIFTLKNLSVNKKPEELYYFEENDSVLTFGKNGSSLIFGQFSSVEDVFC